MSIELRRNTHAIAKATTWGTSVTLGVESIIYPTGTGGNEGQDRDTVYNPGAGYGLIMYSTQGPNKPAPLKFSVWAYEDCVNALMLLCMIYGNNAVTGAGDPYTHTGIFQEVSEYMFTYGNENGTEEFRIPTASLEGLTIKFDTGANVLVFDCTAKGNKFEISTDTTSIFATATAKAVGAPFKMQSAALWINTQSAGALSSNDEIEVIDLQIDNPRPSDEVHASGNSEILQPKQGGMPERKMMFKIPHKSAASTTLYNAFIANTTQKVKITFSGSSASRELCLYEPQARLTKVTSPDAEVIATEVEIQLEKAAAAPTGMANASPYFTWKTDVATSPIA